MTSSIGIPYCDPVACQSAGCTPTLCTGAGVGSNAALFERSRRAIPGGVNSSIRAFKAVGGEPYVVPVSFGYDGHSLYLHTAPKGRKIEPLQGGARVCCQLERGVELVRDARDACRWTFAYESVIGWGTAEELTTPEAKQAGLNHIMRQYSGRDWRMPEG